MGLDGRIEKQGWRRVGGSLYRDPEDMQGCVGLETQWELREAHHGQHHNLLAVATCAVVKQTCRLEALEVTDVRVFLLNGLETCGKVMLVFVCSLMIKVCSSSETVPLEHAIMACMVVTIQASLMTADLLRSINR